MINQTIRTLSLLLAGTLASACAGAEGEGEMTSEELDALDSESFGQLGEALGTGEQCQSALANKTVTGDFDPSFTSPTSYGSNACASGYLLDVNSYTDTLATHIGNTVQFSNTDPTTSTECERHRTGVFVWRKNSNGTTTFVGNKWRWASWVSGPLFSYCDLPINKLATDYAMVEGANYRIASTARRYATPRSSTSSYALRALSFSNVNLPR